MKTYARILREMEAKIGGKDMEKSAAGLIMRRVLQKDGSDFFLMLNETAKDGEEEEMYRMLGRYLRYEPLQYILGYAYFYGLKFAVDERVLIPRFDTEILIDLIVKKHANVRRIVDVGTGSGNIAITLKKFLPRCEVYATDVSSFALETARKNAAFHKTDITFLQGDLLLPCIERGKRFDLIVSNPPYLVQGDPEISPFVADKEPAVALYADNDGLAVYEKLFQQALSVLTENGIMICEISYNRAAETSRLAQRYFGKNSRVRVYRDIEGRDRALEITIGETDIENY